MHENEAWFQREDGTCPKWTKLFLEKLDEASIMSGNRLNVAGDQKQHILDAGFVNVHDEVFKVARVTPLREFIRLVVLILTTFHSCL
jgi:hypothetical protein